MDQDVVSFVLRFVREAGEAQEARWRGIIKHVQSNNESQFTQFGEALTFMQAHVNDVVQRAMEGGTPAAGEPATGAPANPFLETARLWGEMMPRYTELMMDAVRESMESPFAPSAFNEQMERAMDAALAAWGLPRREAQSKATDEVAALNQELAELRQRVAGLEAALRLASDGTGDEADAAD